MIVALKQIIRQVLEKRHLIFAMAKREVQNQYAGSMLGFLWVFIHPVVMITVFWFVFSIGFKTKPMNDVPFVVWLAAGLAPWFFFAEIINGSTNSIVNHGHLIKRTIFSSEILPAIKILSCSVTHLAFLLVLLVLIIFQKLPFTFYYLQAGYYLICLLTLALGLAMTVSALNVFIRDIAQLVAVLIQIGFWITPIFWDIQMMPTQVQRYLKLNPVFYIIQGYRESFISFVPFWSHPLYTVYFWTFSFTVLISGAFIFRRLKPQFADVL
jgi:lipopolysaccharide transport system permease protein/teichoic acid transport system permease protein